MKNKGFTLIEVMISLTILSALSLLAAKSIQQGVKTKEKLQVQIDDISQIRDSLKLIERDVNLAFHYRDLEVELNELIKKKQNPNQQQPQPGFGGAQPPPQQQPPPPTQPQAPRRDPVTQFIGGNDKMSFVTTNNSQWISGARQADFIEVGYEWKECSSQDSKQKSKCLWRRSSTSVDLDVTRGGEAVVMLENVTEFELQYIGKGKTDWVGEWRSDSGGDGATKDNFPLAVRISLKVEKGSGDQAKKYSTQIVANVHFPNNKADASGN